MWRACSSRRWPTALHAVGESFHAVSPGALTLRGYAEAVAGWFGHDARLAYLPWEEWRQTVSADAARVTRDHLVHSPHCSMDKAARLLGFHPRYAALDTVLDAIDGLVSLRKAGGEAPRV